MYALDCLLEIKKDDSAYLGLLPGNVNLQTPILAKHINAKVGIFKRTKATIPPSKTQFERVDILFNDQEYTPLKGGQLDYSVTDKVEDIPDLYFGKYPVTNKSYRRFINYLKEQDMNLIDQLPVEIYYEKLNEFATPIEGYHEYLSKDKQKWLDKLVSHYDEDRKFNEDEQPVVGISWYAAKAYCLWLSLFESVSKKGGLDRPLKDVANIYRLPKDLEWERAAKGIKKDNSYPRPYPWGNTDPSPEHANFKNNVGHTTPVSRYPDGETPDGIMDMAGNVWEWLEDNYDYQSSLRVLRGGSWDLNASYLASSFRDGGLPQSRGSNVGFRVVRPGH